MMSKTIHIFIGYDSVESVAYHTLCESILARSSVPVAIHPVKRSLLKDIHKRPIDEKQSNEFSFTRFLVPHLMGYKGYAIFMDCDMLVLDDIKNLMDMVDWTKSVSVVKHEYEPKNTVKYLGAVQYPYPRKNWSSVMIFNCAHSDCKKLTPEYVDSAPGMELHRLQWTQDDRIGELPVEYNHLVGEYPPNPNAKIVHFTVGGPYFHEYEGCEYSDEWFKERALMTNCNQRHV